MYLESNNQMNLRTREENNFLFCFDETIKNENDENIVYVYEAIRTPLLYTYDLLVSTIIKEKYPDDKMQAIINNHLLNDGDEEHEKVFNEMQQWRKHAKKIAKDIMLI